MTQYGDGPGTGSRMRAYYDATGDVAIDSALAVASVTPANWGGSCEIVDLTIDDSRNTAEFRRRCNDFAKGLPAKRNVTTVEFRLIFGLDATARNDFIAMYNAGSIRHWQFASGDKDDDDAIAFSFPAFLTGLPWDQPLEDVSGHDMTLSCGFLEIAGVEQDPHWKAAPPYGWVV